MPLLTVEVNEDDIDKGAQRDSWLCPICRALFRITRMKWVVLNDRTYLLGNGDRPIWLPLSAQQWIKDYDAKGYASPISFQIEVPQ